MSGPPYISSADSSLLRRALRRYSGGRCLEIGAGNGGTLVDLKGRFEEAVGTDLVRPAMEDWKLRGADFVLSDRGTCFRDGTFDLVAFNPPYLEGGGDDRAVDGGAGLAVPLGFMQEGLRVAKPTGAVVLVLDAGSDLEPFDWEGARAGFSLARIDAERLFYEELAVYAATKASSPEIRRGALRS